MTPSTTPTPTSPAPGAPPPPAAGAGTTQTQWWVLMAIGIGTFMSARDGSAVNTVVPLLAKSLQSDVPTVQWVLTVYLLVVSGLLLGMGRWGDLAGHKRVYLGGFVVFIIASLFCSLSPTAGWLIAARAVQAIGAAMLFASGPAIIAQNFPPERRGQALGMQLTMTYLGLTMGPLLGGWLAQNLGWPSVFWLNVPIGIPALYVSWRFIPGDRGHETGKRFDYAGGVLVLAGLGSLLLGLNKAHKWGWTSPAIVGLLLVGAALLAFFFWVEGKIRDPMLDLSLLRNRTFSTAAVSAMLTYVGLYSTLFLIPLYMQDGRGLDATRTGWVLAAQPFAMAAIAAFSGAISDKIGTRWPTIMGLGTLAVGLFLLAQLTATSTIAFVVLGLALAGLGTGMFVSPNNSAMLGAAPRERRGIASGIMATARNVGMSLGIGMAEAIYSTVKAHGQAQAQPDALFQAIRAGFLGACVVAAAGVVITAIRDK